jgi:hypothetical protein
LGRGSDRTQNIQYGAARASRLAGQVADHIGGSARVIPDLLPTHRDGGAVPEVVQPDRRQALTAGKPDESAVRYPGV